MSQRQVMTPGLNQESTKMTEAVWTGPSTCLIRKESEMYSKWKGKRWVIT